jgi:MFS family permease
MHSDEPQLDPQAAAAPARVSTRLPSIFRSLGRRDFALFWSGNFLSNIGTWMQNLALGWLIIIMTNSPFLLGLNGFLASAPSLVFSLPGGAIADRLNRKKLMMYGQSVMAGLALLLAALTSFHVVTIGEILLISLLMGTAFALNNPAYQALVPDLVGREDLMNAVALNSVQFNLSRAIGPTLGGLALGAMGAAACFYLNAASFLPLIFVLMIITVPVYHLEEGPTVWGVMLEGLRFVKANRMLVVLLSVPSFLSLLGLPFITLMPAYAKNVLHVGASDLGYLLGGAGIGAVVSALTLAARGDLAHKSLYIFASSALFAVALIFLSQARTFWGAFLWLIIIGGTMVGSLALTNTTLQLVSPPQLRGRIMSMYSLTVMGFAPLGNLQAGAVAQALGIRFALALGGVICLVYFVILLLLLPRLRRMAQLPQQGQ